MDRMKRVRFVCPHCEAKLTSPARTRGQRRSCPRCSNGVDVPIQAKAPASKTPVVQVVVPTSERIQKQAPVIPFVIPVSEPVRKEQPTVPLKFALPQNLGGVETTVSQKTANDIGKMLISGILVVLGFIVGIKFGHRTSA